jgi:hypothetical protein
LLIDNLAELKVEVQQQDNEKMNENLILMLPAVGTTQQGSIG